jgi:hypothetical protein
MRQHLTGSQYISMKAAAACQSYVFLCVFGFVFLGGFIFYFFGVFYFYICFFLILFGFGCVVPTTFMQNGSPPIPDTVSTCTEMTHTA